MKNYILSIFFLVSIGGHAQCFSIETILADACGDPEGENEMVRINVLQDLNINQLSVDWPNNPFLSWCADAQLTNSLNQGIVSSCGILLEPINGIVPQGKKLLIVTSTNMLINANSFDGLTDTVYIIYQCSGNTWGHFSNGASGTRTLTLNYSGTCTQSQSVVYTPSDLIGGDGAAVSYNTQGQATYYNTGCSAPVPSIFPKWTFPSRICNSYGIIDLDNFLTPSSAVGSWSGDIENGHFFNSTGKLGNYSITYTVADPNNCLPSADSTIQFVVETHKSGNDTVVACDSINQFDIWLTKDTIVEIPIDFNNEYICDSTIVRYYFIYPFDVDINPKDIVLDSEQTEYVFEIDGSANYSYSIESALAYTCPSSCVETNIFPVENGEYLVVFEDLDHACSKEIALNISVDYTPELNIPNTFTPNQDGENDVFKIFTKDIESLNFKIYDQWGALMFEGNSTQDVWNGTFKNKSLASGTYLVQVQALGKDGKNYKELISLNLVR